VEADFAARRDLSRTPFFESAVADRDRSGDIEAWGRGIHRIFTACREAGTPEPRLRVESRAIWVEFPFSAAYVEQIAGGRGEASGGTTQKATQELIWIERLGERLGETEGRVLFLIHRDSRISTRVLADEIGVSTTSVDKTLARLKDKGILRRVGPARGGHWEILDDADE
jgi:ATP-dependent DNA helicase RecG